MPAIPNRVLLDVNVVIAAVFEDHFAHNRARTFADSLVEFCTTPTVQGGFLRFATRPWKDEAGEHRPRLSMSAALATLRDLTQAAGHRFLPDDAQYHELGMRGHRQWTDAYLLHIARKHGLSLATLDERISSLDDPASPALYVVT